MGDNERLYAIKRYRVKILILGNLIIHCQHEVTLQPWLAKMCLVKNLIRLRKNAK